MLRIGRRRYIVRLAHPNHAWTRMHVEPAAVAVGEEAELVTIGVHELRMFALAAEHHQLVDRNLHAGNVRNLGDASHRPKG